MNITLNNNPMHLLILQQFPLMNLCFVLDNSLSMSQQAYNGLTLLQIAKGYTQKALLSKSYHKIYNGQAINYHLYTSSSNIPLSTYQHEELHFLQQLKHVENDLNTDIVKTLESMFKDIGKYRVMYQAQTTFGTIDPIRLKPSLVMVFTDSLDPIALNVIEQKILSQNMKCKYDCEVYFIKICPPSGQDKTPIESLRKSVEEDKDSEKMKQIAEYWNGKYFMVHRFQYGFEVVQSILSSFVPRIHIKFHVVDNTSPINNNYHQTGICGVESKSTTFIEKNEFVISSIHKGRNRRAIIPLPVLPPTYKMQIRPGFYQIESFHNPTYILDVSKTINRQYLHEFLPYQKLQLQVCQLTCSLEDHIQYLDMTEEIICFPVFYQPDDRRIPIGLLKYDQSTSFQFLIYMPNFLDFNSVYQLMREKYVNQKAGLIILHNMVSNYLLKIPTMYDIFIREILILRGFNLDIKPRSQDLLQLNQKVQSSQYTQRGQYIERFFINAKNHEKYSSTCCPVYSNFYPEWSSNKKSIFSNENPTDKDMRLTIQKMLELKSDLMYGLIDDISLDVSELRSMTVEISSYNIKSGGQNEPLGNPYKRKKRAEIKQIKVEQVKIEKEDDRADFSGKDELYQRMSNMSEMTAFNMLQEMIDDKLQIGRDEEVDLDEYQDYEINKNHNLKQQNVKSIISIQQKQLSDFYQVHQLSKSQFQQIQQEEEEIKIEVLGQGSMGRESTDQLFHQLYLIQQAQEQSPFTYFEQQGFREETDMRIEEFQGYLQSMIKKNEYGESDINPQSKKNQPQPISQPQFQPQPFEQLMINSLPLLPSKTQRYISLQFNSKNITFSNYSTNQQILLQHKLTLPQ